MNRVAICSLWLASTVAWIACASPAEHSASDDVSLPLAAGSTADRLPGLGKGFLVWESNRSGRWRIWYRNLDGSGLRQLSPEEEGRDHFAPHISPDGTHMAYLSYPTPLNAYRGIPKRVSPAL